MRRLMGFVVAMLVVVAIGYALYRSGPSLPERGVLVVELGGPLGESPPTDTISRFTAAGAALPTVTLQLEKAAADPRIVAVLLHLRPIQSGYARIQELRDAVRRTSDAGTEVIALLDMATFNATRELYLASAADRVYVTAGYLGPFAGIAGEYLFLGGLFERIGVQLDYERIGEYKSAPESLAGRAMSEPAREVANAVLDGIFGQILAGVSEGRELPVDDVRALVEGPPSTARDVIEAKLVDGIASRADVLQVAGFETAEEVEFGDYLQLDPSDLGLRDGPAIALIFGDGTIVQSGSGLRGPRFTADRVTQALQDAADSEDVVAIVLRINSGGGSAQASDDIWQALRTARETKPVVVSMADAAASGGYYIASGADAIVAEPATLTGSIGVFLTRPSLQGLYAKLDIGTEVISRGPFARIGAASLPMSDAMRERAAYIVASLYQDFLTRVSTGRGMDPERIDDLGRGRVWLGASARDLGLVDELGGLYSAVARAKAEAGIDPEVDPRRVIYPGPRSLGDQLRELLQASLASFLAEELGLPPIPDGVQRWLVALDSPFAYLPEHWIEIY